MGDNRGTSLASAVVRVAIWEVRKTLRSKKLVLLLAGLAVLPVVAAPISLEFSQAYDSLDVMPFWHIVRDQLDPAQPVLILYLLSAWGKPVVAYPVTIYQNPGATAFPLATDASGLIRFALSTAMTYDVKVDYHQYPTDIFIGPEEMNVTATAYDVRPSGSLDLDFDMRSESQLLHAVRAFGGLPATDLSVWRNGSLVGHFDGHGYVNVNLPPGESEVVVRNETTVVLRLAAASYPGSGNPALARRQGPSFVYAFLWTLLVPYLIPLISIPLAVETIALERSLGVLDLVRVRPVSRLALALGKVLGILGTLAIAVLCATTAIGAIASLTFQELVPAGTFLGFLAAQLYLSAVFVVLTMLVCTVVTGVTNVFIVMGSVWVLLGPGWTTLVVPAAGPAMFINPLSLSTQLFSGGLPQIVALAWKSLATIGDSVTLWWGAGFWLLVPLGLLIFWWYLPQLRSGLRRRHPDSINLGAHKSR